MSDYVVPACIDLLKLYLESNLLEILGHKIEALSLVAGGAGYVDQLLDELGNARFSYRPDNLLSDRTSSCFLSLDGLTGLFRYGNPSKLGCFFYWAAGNFRDFGFHTLIAGLKKESILTK